MCRGRFFGREIVKSNFFQIRDYCFFIEKTTLKIKKRLLNECSVSDASSTTYPYKCLFDLLLSYNSEAKKTTLATSMYHDDNDEGKDSFFSTTTSSALAHRNKWIKGSKEVHFVTGIHADIFRSFRLLPPNIGKFKWKFILIFYIIFYIIYFRN